MNQPLAYIHPGAKIAKNVVVEPFTTIHNNVVIGEGTWIGSNVTIMEGARIGKNCNIFPGAIISATPQDLKYAGEETIVEIGDNTTIRECATINRGTSDRQKTKIGKNCKIGGAAMILGHLKINDNITISPGTMITKSLNKSNNKYTAIMPFMEHKDWLKLATKLREKEK